MATAWSVPPLWRGETVVCLAPGPSLTAEQANAVRGRAGVRVIAITRALALAPWADLLYACDADWWTANWEKGARDFPGLKVALEDPPYPEVLRLGWRKTDGFDRDPRYLATGQNSGYQAIHLAAHLAGRRILLVGYDLRPAAGGRRHFDGEYETAKLRKNGNYSAWLRRFPGLAIELSARGIDVINCTPGSALTAFRRLPLAAALKGC